VHDSLGVRGLERVRDLDPDVEERGDLEGAPADALGESLALEELHGDERAPVVLVDRVDGADPGVVELGSGLGLPLETLEGGRVLRHLRGQELQGDVAAELRVLGLVHDAHAPAAQPRGDPVVRDRLADHRRVVPMLAMVSPLGRSARAVHKNAQDITGRRGRGRPRRRGGTAMRNTASARPL
jgi:hypothetical protein